MFSMLREWLMFLHFFLPYPVINQEMVEHGTMFGKWVLVKGRAHHCETFALINPILYIIIVVG